jgi:hypothetical protein
MILMRSRVAYMTIPFQMQLFPDSIKFYFSSRSATHLRFQDMIHICDLKVYTHPNQFGGSSGEYFQWDVTFLKSLGTDGGTVATLALIAPLLTPLSANLLPVGALPWYIHLICLDTDAAPSLLVASSVPSPSVGVTV